MVNDIGQNINVWSDSWVELNPEKEIRIWDYFALRKYILKYTPRFGKSIEAGCGLGRFNFLLNKFDVDIEGVDFSDEIIERNNEWQSKNNMKCKFIEGNITNLNYEDNTISCYLSFGVLEHFIEGPKIPLDEAYRILRPGGIAIISTPNKSFYVRFVKAKTKLIKVIRKILFKKNKKQVFFQYEYTRNQLKKFIKKSSFHISRAENCDFLYVFNEIGGFNGKNIREGSFAYKFSKYFENNNLFNFFSAQSIVIAVKKADFMHCFLCNDLSAIPDYLKLYDVPICKRCQARKIADYYKKNKTVKYSTDYIIEPTILKPENRICDFCNAQYLTDNIFEDYGLRCNVCQECLKKPEINIEISNNSLKPIWRKRI